MEALFKFLCFGAIEADFARQNDHFKECLAAATKHNFFEIFFSRCTEWRHCISTLGVLGGHGMVEW